MNSPLCVFVCKYLNKTIEVIRKQKQLILNKTELTSSSKIMKRTSAPDTRKTSRVVGTVGPIFLKGYGLSVFFSALISAPFLQCIIQIKTKTTQFILLSRYKAVHCFKLLSTYQRKNKSDLNILKISSS